MKTSPLAEIRAKIDELDRCMVRLLARRFDLALTITREGLKKKFTDPAREKRVLANAAAAAGSPEYAGAARAVFAEVIRQTKKIQKC